MREPCLTEPPKLDPTIPALVTEGCPEGLRCMKPENWSDVINDVAAAGEELARIWDRCKETGGSAPVKSPADTTAKE